MSKIEDLRKKLNIGKINKNKRKSKSSSRRSSSSKGKGKGSKNFAITKANFKIIAILAVVALIVIVCTAKLFYSKLSHYGGAGEAKQYEANVYDLSRLTREGGLAYNDGTYKSRRGIDVSVFQGYIDWNKVKAAGVEFAMIRLGYSGSVNGKIQMDKNFYANLEGAKKAGLDVGIYFFSQAITTDEAIEEARYVVDRIRFKGIEMPVAFDMEPVHSNGRISALTAMEKTEIADAFCQVIRRNGYEPVIYGNPYWMNNSLLLEYLTDYDLWLAHYTGATSFPYKYKMWQYTERGIVDGIKTKVDFNLYFEKI